MYFSQVKSFSKQVVVRACNPSTQCMFGKWRPGSAGGSSGAELQGLPLVVLSVNGEHLALSLAWFLPLCPSQVTHSSQPLCSLHWLQVLCEH